MQPTVHTLVPDMPPIELVSYYDDFVSYYPYCEPSTKRWFVDNVKEDWTFLDCGANIGYFSILFGRLAPKGCVYAFEPTTTYDMLLQNLAHHRLQNVKPFRLALGDKSGEIEDSIFRIWGQDAERQSYRFITIDEFVRQNLLGRVDCIKIDVDSFDFDVLKGAKETLLALNPYVMVELNHALDKRRQSNVQALEWLAELGYQETVLLDGENFLLKRGVDVADTVRSTSRPLSIHFENSAKKPQGFECDGRRSKHPSGPKALPTSPYTSPAGLVPSSSFEVEFRDGSRFSVPTVHVKELHKHLGLEEPVNYPESSYQKPFANWQMELDDCPIFRYIYRHFQPQRHLEFGTWQGTGAIYCLEESAATVWTMNLPLGEAFPDGNSAYTGFPHGSTREDFLRWTNEVNIHINGDRTDSFGAVGWQYLQRGLGHRVCQIYCDSTQWDTSNFPAGFFDTVLVDGGHTKDIVISDTLKALPLVRKGGLVMWHDFCAAESFTATVGVMRAIMHLWTLLEKEMSQLFWIYPSWILLGVKK